MHGQTAAAQAVTVFLGLFSRPLPISNTQKAGLLDGLSVCYDTTANLVPAARQTFWKRYGH